jgi:hypothetical protein
LGSSPKKEKFPHNQNDIIVEARLPLILAAWNYQAVLISSQPVKK